MPVHDRNMHKDAATAREYAFPAIDPAARTASATALGGFVIQKECYLERIGAYAVGTVSGTGPTLSVEARVGATLILGTPNITAAGFANRQVSAINAGVALKKGDVLQIDFIIGGTTPSFADVKVWIALRTGGADVQPGFDMSP